MLFKAIKKNREMLYSLVTALDKRIEVLIDKRGIETALEKRRKNQTLNDESSDDNSAKPADDTSMSDGDDIGEDVLPGAVMASMDLFGWSTQLIRAEDHPFLMEVYCIQ